MGKVRIRVWESNKLVEREHEVEVVERDIDRNYLILKLDGNEVRVERFTEEDWRDWVARMEKEFLRILNIRIDYIKFSDRNWNRKKKDYSKIIYRRKALAIYRLIWYFGPPLRISVGNQASCQFEIKYKGYVFEIDDVADSDDFRIDMIHLIPKEEVYSIEVRKKYEPPKEIEEEVMAIFEYLTKNPVKISMSGLSMAI